MTGSRAGYTLMELVVVLAVLAIATALVAPAVGRTAEDVAARAQVASVAAFLRGAREQAVTSRQTVEVRVDRDAHALLLRRAAREGEDTPAARRAFAAALRVESATTPSAIVFQPQGMSSGARVMVETTGPRLFVVTVDALTGRVTTQRVAR
jgi:general secretion pathway protein H